MSCFIPGPILFTLFLRFLIPFSFKIFKKNYSHFIDEETRFKKLTLTFPLLLRGGSKGKKFSQQPKLVVALSFLPLLPLKYQN